MLEKVVSTPFEEYLNECKFLPTEHAYRQGHSAEDAVTLVVNNVLLARDANLCSKYSTSNSLTSSQGLASKGLLWIGLSAT